MSDHDDHLEQPACPAKKATFGSPASLSFLSVEKYVEK